MDPVGKPEAERSGYRQAFACAPEQTRAVPEHPEFKPSEEWQEILPGQHIPSGLKINLDIATGKRFGKLIPKNVVVVEDLEYVKGQVEAGVDVDNVDNEGSTMLHRACAKGALDVVQLLVQSKANVNKMGKRFTPLQLATTRGHEEVVKYLVEVAKADVTAMSKSGKLSLHLAAATGNVALVSFFLSRKKAKPDALTRSGDTALHEAGPQGHLAVLKCLLEHKANVEIKNNEGKTAAECCDDYEQIEMGDFLRAVLSERALDSLMDDLDMEDGGSAKSKKGKNKSKPQKAPAAAKVDEQAQPKKGSSKKKKNKNKKNKNKKNKAKKQDGDDEGETASCGGGLVVRDTPPAPAGGGGGGGGMVVIDNQPARTITRPPPTRKVESESESESESEDDLDADLD